MVGASVNFAAPTSPLASPLASPPASPPAFPLASPPASPPQTSPVAGEPQQGHIPLEHQLLKVSARQGCPLRPEDVASCGEHAPIYPLLPMLLGEEGPGEGFQSRMLALSTWSTLCCVSSCSCLVTIWVTAENRFRWRLVRQCFNVSVSRQSASETGV